MRAPTARRHTDIHALRRSRAAAPSAARTRPASIARSHRPSVVNTPAVRQAPQRTLRSMSPAERERNRVALAQLRGQNPYAATRARAASSRSDARRGSPVSPLTAQNRRPHVRTPVTSGVDIERYRGRRTGSLGRSNLAYHETRTRSRSLGTRRVGSARTGFGHRPARHPHLHGGHHHGHGHGIHATHARRRHHLRHRHRAVFIPLPYYRYPVYPTYPVYPLLPSPGYQDDTVVIEHYCPEGEPIEEYEEFVEYEDGFAPGTAPVAPAPLPAPAPVAPVAPTPEADAPEAPRPDAPADAFELGVEAFHASEYAQAQAHFQAAVKADAEDGEAWMALLHAAFMLDAYDVSAEALAQAARLGAFPRGYRFDARTLFKDPTVFDRALTRLEDENRRHPRNMDAWLLRAYFHVAAGEVLEAQTAIQRVLLVKRKDPTGPVLHTALLPPVEDAQK